MKENNKSDSIFLIIIIFLILGGSYYLIQNMQKLHKNSLKLKDQQIQKLEQELEKLNDIPKNDNLLKKIEESDSLIKNANKKNEELLNSYNEKIDGLTKQIINLDEKCTAKVIIKKIKQPMPIINKIIVKKIEKVKIEPIKEEKKPEIKPEPKVIEEKSQIYIINNNIQEKKSTNDPIQEPVKKGHSKPRMPIDILK